MTYCLFYKYCWESRHKVYVYDQFDFKEIKKMSNEGWRRIYV